ncbi:MAG: FAD-dependent monooxygenase [Pseudomonadota bacterium]
MAHPPTRSASHAARPVPGGAVVVGGGIAGLSAALALAHRDTRSQLLEASSAHRESGAGVQLGPNASWILRELGILDALYAADAISQPTALRVYDGRSDAALGGMPLRALEARHGAPYITVRRSALHAALRDRCAALGSAIIDLRLGQAVTRVDAEGAGVVATCADGAQVHGRLLIGSDGAGSALRRHYHPAAILQFSGATAGRAVLARSQLSQHSASDLCANVSVWLLPNAHIVAYPVDAGRYLNVVLITKPSQSSRPAQPHADPLDAHADAAGWRGVRALDLAAHFPDRRGLSPCVQALLACIEASPPAGSQPDACGVLGAWALHTIAQLPDPVLPLRRQTDNRSGDGRETKASGAGDTVSQMSDPRAPALVDGTPRAVLIGDAWHPVLPFLAQGAAMAIEDAWVLAGVVGTGRSLDIFAGERAGRVARVSAAAQRNGRIFHMSGPAGMARNMVMRALPGTALMLQYDWLYGAKVS